MAARRAILESRLTWGRFLKVDSLGVGLAARVAWEGLVLVEEALVGELL